MRYVYTILIVMLLGLLIVFEVQNLESVTISFFTYSSTLPLSIIVMATYLFGMLTGGFLLSLVRIWLRKAAGIQKEEIQTDEPAPEILN